jgi:hypothetical protein
MTMYKTPKLSTAFHGTPGFQEIQFEKHCSKARTVTIVRHTAGDIMKELVKLLGLQDKQR